VTISEVPGLVTGEDPVNPDGFRSIMCDCAMNYITCVPEDRFEVVLYCDASSATVSTMDWMGFKPLIFFIFYRTAAIVTYPYKVKNLLNFS
jgi:hypothetical protein